MLGDACGCLWMLGDAWGCLEAGDKGPSVEMMTIRWHNIVKVNSVDFSS